MYREGDRRLITFLAVYSTVTSWEHARSFGHVSQTTLRAATTTVPPVLSCGPDSVPYAGECLHIFHRPSKWLDADAVCQHLNGARLVTIVDQAMNDFLAGIIRDDVWIGLHDTHEEGSWRWVDDTPVNYTNFNSGDGTDQRGDADVATVSPEHTTNCVVLRSGTGKWKDVSCHSTKGSICALPRGEPLCPDGGTFFRDRCYWYNLVNNWDNANRDCENRFGSGVKLVIVRDAELNAFLSRHVHPTVWLGLRYNHGDDTWRWVDGSPLDHNGYERWSDGELENMQNGRDCAVLNHNDVNGGHWSRSYCTPYTRTVCALQTCYNGDTDSPDEEPNCLDFGDQPKCSCVSNALCRLTGKCHCDPLFDGMKCDKDELTVTIHAPRRVERGANVTMRCHVNLPSTDVTVLWRKVSGTEMLPEGRTRLQDRPEVGDYDLIIENLQENDTGSYVCAATTVIGQIGESEMDSTYLHVAVPDVPTPLTPGKVYEGNNEGLSSRETGLIVAVGLLSVCFVCLLIAFIAVQVRHAFTQRHTRRPSDMLM
ncbi:macrophage mannose receptor 1-like isoform X2 [Patiria miniata]|uniref:Uncharacterized protein n=1 Tax=Patiria miniata TaxID=46514 RepID=A0A914AI50_PATMI|nr:macrophage mannose receptor 1-like isoform X2 [Patiria miniata]